MHFSALAPNVSKVFTFQIDNLQKVAQGQRVFFSNVFSIDVIYQQSTIVFHVLLYYLQDMVAMLVKIRDTWGSNIESTRWWNDEDAECAKVVWEHVPSVKFFKYVLGNCTYSIF